MKTTIPNHNHQLCEKKWQKIWAEKNTFKFDEKSAKEKYYVLEMFPYPSGKIHMGHLRNYAIGDALARFKKLQGFNVLHPMGFDAFGLPAENAALEHKIHPQNWTISNVENMRAELKSIGLSLDWSREVITCLPDYYKHEQKIFLDFLKAGLAYQKESFVNWDPIDQTVLANEQVIDGRGWRSGALVEKKKLKQWFLKVSDFSEELLAELKNLKGWDERVLSMQEKWIGKSEGLLVDFDLTPSPLVGEGGVRGQKSITIYTTRPDTLFGASFIAISPHHPIALELLKTNVEIKNFIEEASRSAVNEEAVEKQEKKGITTGLKVKHPFDENWQLDIYIANFVLMEYGTGAIFGCPAHDERDFEFAKKYNLPIKQVVADLSKFLQETDLIDFSNQEIQALVAKIKSQSKNEEIELVRAAYHFVRDEINHAMDDEKFSVEKPNLKASEVLKNNHAFCFGKASLLAAILRALKIPCGFSDQLLMFDETISERKIIHTMNVVYLQSLQKWIRLDARGNKPEDVNAEFSLDEEIIAYPARKEFGEINDLGIYPDISAAAISMHKNCKTNAEIIENLFAESFVEISQADSSDGVMINSDFLNGLTCAQAKEKVFEILSDYAPPSSRCRDDSIPLNRGNFKNQAQKKTNFRLRDWGVSRQRYWGCPIPILYLEDGSIVPVPEEDLPVKLPEDVEFKGQGDKWRGNPLANHPTWKFTTYKGQKAIRETDTFDTFFESSWYFLRYISQPENKAFDKDLANKFMPVDQYIGGVEHAVLHLLYARFFTKALKKCGYLDVSEPFKNLLTQGMVCHHTFKSKDGKWLFPTEVIKREDGKFYHQKTGEEVVFGRSEKMSKSKKNVVEPIHIVESYGADVARLFMLSDSPASRDLEWSESGIDGAWKYVNRLWKLVAGFSELKNFSAENSQTKEQNEITKLTHQTIAAVSDEYEKMGFNRAIAKIREFSNALEKFIVKSESDAEVMNFALKNLVILFSPIMPHLAEELWQKLGGEGLASEAEFPKFNEKFLVEDVCKIAVQVLGKLRAVIEMPKGLSKEEAENLALQNENVRKFIEEKKILKIITVQDKLVNVVVG